MRILLVNGLFGKLSISEAIGISVLASVIRNQGFEDTHVYDPCVDGDGIEVGVSRALAYKPEIIGISVIGTDNSDVYNFVMKYREKNSKTIIVIGGHGPSLDYYSFLFDGVQAVFVGESELSFTKFLKLVHQGKDYCEVPGLAHKANDGTIHLNESFDRIDNLDKLPQMARDNLVLLKKKYGDSIYAQICGSRGCYMTCNYCSIKAFSKLQRGKIYRERSVDSIVLEMKNLYEIYGITKFDFIDDNFMPQNPLKAEEKINYFCHRVKELGIGRLKLHMQCRPDNIQIDLIERLTEIGLRSIFIGIESVNQEDLNLYGKNIKTERIHAAMDSLNRIGFSCNINNYHRIKVGYINFNPYSDRGKLRRSLDFLRKYEITPKKICSRLSPLYKTKVYDTFLEKNLLNPDGTAKFISEEIEELFNYSKEIIDYILEFRERIRLPYKMYLELGAKTKNREIDELRKGLDVMCYEVFEDLLVSKPKEFPRIRDKYVNIINALKCDRNINKHLGSLEIACGINSKNIGLIRMR